jgi:HTH-type transcriptional regulator/antitoxin HipB
MFPGGTTTPRRLSTVLRERREEAGLTQEVLAKRARVSRGYVAKLEAGHSKNPSIGTLKRLAKELGVPVTELLE